MMNKIEPPTEEAFVLTQILKMLTLIQIGLGVVKMFIALDGFSDLINSLILYCSYTGLSYCMLIFYMFWTTFSIMTTISVFISDLGLLSSSTQTGLIMFRLLVTSVSFFFYVFAMYTAYRAYQEYRRCWESGAIQAAYGGYSSMGMGGGGGYGGGSAYRAGDNRSGYGGGRQPQNYGSGRSAYQPAQSSSSSRPANNRGGGYVAFQGQGRQLG
mmetsp:Transcript_62121/g.71210  ORF Transcript_62121/g.71210 Transcript_62121/m.71210 type:complete len:213 (-) Transcript_62121:227-865(-)